MVEQGLTLLTLHIFWKARRFPDEPGEADARAAFVEQRQMLLDKLVEFSVGTQSNTADGVRRVVRAPSTLAWK
jgi:cohesin complex subunit SA-1/2